MSELEIERLGGLAGFGSPQGRVRSVGSVSWSELADGDRAIIEALFERGAGRSDARPDEFTYRLTRRSANGELETVEAPGSDVPVAIRNRVRDELR